MPVWLSDIYLVILAEIYLIVLGDPSVMRKTQLNMYLPPGRTTRHFLEVLITLTRSLCNEITMIADTHGALLVPGTCKGLLQY